MKKRIAIAIFCFSGVTCIANTHAKDDVVVEGLETFFYVDSDFYSDRDDLKINTWSAGYQKGHDIFDYQHEKDAEKEWLWRVNVSRSSIDQDADANLDDYRRYDLSATLAQKFNETLSAELALGDVQIKNKMTNKKDHLMRYGVKAKAQLHPTLTLHAEHERNYLLDQGIVEGEAGNLLYGDTSGLNFYWRPEEKWRVEGQVSQQAISDGNASRKVSASLLYGISPGWPWIWTGVTAETLRYDEDKSSYWTPNKYRSYGVIAESSFAFNDTVNMSLGATINRNKEDSHSSGTGYSISAGSDWEVAENITLKAKGYLLESTQASSEWQQDQINLSINIKSY